MKDEKPPKGLKNWLKGLGVAGFIFFLVKGIIWLLVFFGAFQLTAC